MALIDISRSLSPSTAVWPGDQGVEWTWTARKGENGSSVNLGAMQLSAHAGTHVDAPFHIDDNGTTIESFSLSAFAGPAHVVDVSGDSWVRPEHVDGLDAERVLFKTNASDRPDDVWPEEIVALAPEMVHQLAKQGTVLVGTDAPSVDPLDSKRLPAHHALVDAGIVNLEALRLDHVSPGQYFLMAFPLKIKGGDAAPVRAVLSEMDDAVPSKE